MPLWPAKQNKKKYWGYYPHQSRDSASPVCGIFSVSFFKFKNKKCIFYSIYHQTSYSHITKGLLPPSLWRLEHKRILN